MSTLDPSNFASLDSACPIIDSCSCSFVNQNGYFTIFIFFLVGLALAILIFALSWLLGSSQVLSDKEKVSAYECGFNPFEDARNQFDVRFYLVAILFIIFDLEVSFLFPWSTVLGQITLVGYWTMFLFLFILIIGFIYEWKKGALEWE